MNHTTHIGSTAFRFPLLTFFQPVLERLSDGNVIRTTIAFALRVLAALTLLGGIVLLFLMLKEVFRLDTAGQTIGGLLFAVVLAATFLATYQILIYRAHDVQERASNSAGHIFAGMHPAGLFRSTNNGSTWSVMNLGIVDSVRDVGSIEFTSNGYAWIQVTGRIYRSIVPIVSVGPLTRELPTAFWLGQNYPNPFNPNTTVEFGIPSASSVSIKIFNVLGQEVATILEDNLAAGTYKVEWNAQPFASGTYFYRLLSGSHSETKKLILQK